MAKVIAFRRDRKYEHDPIFFTKDQITLGTVLIYAGRREHSAWIVSRIITTNTRGARHNVPAVLKFSDQVYLRRSNGPPSNAQRAMSFGYLCYSAIWRIG
jgi:hypothetical protein